MITVLLIVLGTAPSIDAPSSAMAVAVADGLGSDGRVSLERVDALPSDAEADAHAAEAEASVVEVSWPGSDGLHAHLHMHLKKSAAWIDRDLAFEASSLPWERGRAVGLAIATMVPLEPEPPPAMSEVMPSPVVATPVSSPIVLPLEEIVTAPDADPPTFIDAPESAPARSQVSLTALGEIASASTGGAGGRLDVAWWITPRFALRATAGGRFASVDVANAHLVRVDGGLGVAWKALGVARDGPSLSLGADLRVARLEVSRGDERTGHTVALAALFIDGEVPLGPHLRVAAALGVEGTPARTQIAVDGARVAELPRVALAGAVGLRVVF